MKDKALMPFLPSLAKLGFDGSVNDPCSQYNFDKEYCESFNGGLGCKKIKECRLYNAKK